jgi:hypothetical protein
LRIINGASVSLHPFYQQRMHGIIYIINLKQNGHIYIQ